MYSFAIVLDPFLPLLCSNFDTCYALWSQAKSLNTNDIQRLYSIVDKLINLCQQGITAFDLSSIKAEFNALLHTILVKLLLRILHVISSLWYILWLL